MIDSSLDLTLMLEGTLCGPECLQNIAKEKEMLSLSFEYPLCSSPSLIHLSVMSQGH